MKSVHIQSYSGPYFLVLRLNTERYGVSLRIQSDCGKMRTRITPNMDTFYAMEATLYSGQFLLRDPEGYFCFDYSSGELNESNFSVTANNYSRESVVPHA